MFRVFYSQIDLSVGKILGRNIVIRFVGIHHSEQKASGHLSFRVFSYSTRVYMMHIIPSRK